MHDLLKHNLVHICTLEQLGMFPRAWCDPVVLFLIPIQKKTSKNIQQHKYGSAHQALRGRLAALFSPSGQFRPLFTHLNTIHPSY